MPRRKRGARILERILRAQARGRTYYAEADKLLDQALEDLGPGAEVDLGDGRVARIVDQFADKRVVWRSSPCHRFKVEVGERA